jgi:hypothetical protein
MGITDPTRARLRLRDLPLPARLVISAFLISVGLGYGAAMVQLKFQHAQKGNAFPTREDVVHQFYGPTGEKPRPKLEVLLEADEGLDFNGGGSMKPAFFAKSAGWEGAKKKLARKGRRGEPTKEQLDQAEAELRTQRETERLAVLDWVRKGADKEAYQNDNFCVSDSLLALPIDDAYVGETAADGGRTIKIKSIFNDRCVRCHKVGGGKAEKYPLDSYEHLQKYLVVNESQAIPKETLIQSTHVHLLSFAMLYGLSGLIFAFTSFPGIIRLVIAPLPLVAQVVDVACWWLTRLDPRYADGIIIAGGVVGAGVGLHILLGLFDMYGKAGKALLFMVLIAVGFAGWHAKDYVTDYLAKEKANASAQQ